MKKHIAWLVAIFVLVTGMFIAAKKVRAPESVSQEENDFPAATSQEPLQE